MTPMEWIFIDVALNRMREEINEIDHAAWHALAYCRVLFSTLFVELDACPKRYAPYDVPYPVIAYWLSTYVELDDKRMCDMTCSFEHVTASGHKTCIEAYRQLQDSCTLSLSLRQFERDGAAPIDSAAKLCVRNARRALMQNAFLKLAKHEQFRRELRRLLYEAYKIFKHETTPKQMHIDAFRDACEKAYPSDLLSPSSSSSKE